MTARTKTDGRPSKEAEALTMAIENFVRALIDRALVPSSGPEAADIQHEHLAEEIERVLS